MVKTQGLQAQVPDPQHPSDLPLNLGVSNWIMTLPALSNHAQAKVILKALSAGLSSDNGPSQLYNTTIVSITYDNVASKFQVGESPCNTF